MLNFWYFWKYNKVGGKIFKHRGLSIFAVQQGDKIKLYNKVGHPCFKELEYSVGFDPIEILHLYTLKCKIIN